MTKSASPYEGKIVIVSYTECDFNGEDNACLVYKVVEGKLKPLLGVLQLPDGTNWHNASYDIDQRALEVIKKEGVTEVYTPLFTAQGVMFFDLELGYVDDLSEELNSRGEIECWCEFGAFHYNWAVIQLLEEHQIRVMYIDPSTMQVVKG